jgi:ribosomal-protein-alanine N-acetyltransferase
VGETIAITIEPMKKDDLDQVLAIEQVSFTMPWSRNLFLAELRSRMIASLLVAVPEGATEREVAGYIVCWIVEDEMHILNLATAPRYRRQGIARQLVLRALNQAYGKGARRAFLEVRVSNTAAQKLYSDLGFTGSFVRRGYYDMPIEDAVVMTLEREAFVDLVGLR